MHRTRPGFHSITARLVRTLGVAGLLVTAVACGGNDCESEDDLSACLDDLFPDTDALTDGFATGAASWFETGSGTTGDVPWPTSWGTDAATSDAATSDAATSDAATSDAATTTDATDATSTTEPVPTGPCDDVVNKGDAGEDCQLDCECKRITSLTPEGPFEQWEIEYDPDQDGKCSVLPLIGGLCGQCNSADDCQGGGCTLPSPLTGRPSYCNSGAFGDGCDADGPNTCQPGLDCGTIIDVPGIVTVSTCSACATSGDCGGPTPYCAPEVGFLDFSGALECVAAGGKALDESCVLGEDAACQTGVCSAAMVMGVIKLGICGECSSDADCGVGESCVDAYVDLDNQGALSGSRCV